MKQEMMDHKQIISTSLQTDNHTTTHHSIFYGQDALLNVQSTASKHWQAMFNN